jgi:hypothetical protein
VSKACNGEKNASSTNGAGKIGYLPAENRNSIHVCHPVLVSTQSGLRTLISDLKLAINTGKNREYSGSNKYRQGLA